MTDIINHKLSRSGNIIKNTKYDQILYVTYCSGKKNQAYCKLLEAIKRYKSKRITTVHRKAQSNGKEFRILSGFFGLISPTKKIPNYDFLLTKPEDIERLESILDNQLNQLKNRGINSIEYYTEKMENPDNKDIIPYYEALKESAEQKKLILSIKDIPPLPEDRMDELKDIRKKMLNSVQKLFKKDRILILVDINERAITHKLAEYLQDEFNNFNVDCEYNRSFDKIKKLDLPKDLLKLKDTSNIKWDDTEAKTIYPDIIVHERKTNLNNILVIEVKKWNNKSSEDYDKMKLKCFTKKPFNYNFGIFLKILNENEISLTLFKDGGQFGNSEKHSFHCTSV